MNRPSFFTYTIGNPISCLFILGLAGYMIFHWWTHQATVAWFIPLIALFMGSGAVNANAQIDSFNAWKRQWEAMAGVAEQREATRRRRWTVARAIGIPGVLLGLAYWLTVHAGESGSSAYGSMLLVFAVLCLWVLVGGMVRLVRWGRRRAASASGKAELDHIVTACLPIPKDSPQIPNSLPDYCMQLLKKRGF